MRLAPAGQQPWLIIGDAIIIANKVIPYQVKMKDDSFLRTREWNIILFDFQEYHDALASLQVTFCPAWERSYMEKPLNEDERQKAQYIFADVQVQLGNREKVCSYHIHYYENDHSNIHYKYSPCYLIAWHDFEITEDDASDMTVTIKPGTYTSQRRV